MQNSTVLFFRQAEILTSAISVCESQDNIDLNLMRGLRSLRLSVFRTAVQSIEQFTTDTFSKR